MNRVALMRYKFPVVAACRLSAQITKESKNALMNNLLPKGVAATIITLLFYGSVLAQGTTVTVFLKDSTRIHGELIGVHKSVIIVLPTPNVGKSGQIALPNDQIVSIFVGGSSRIPESIVVGAFLGSVAGALTENGLKQSLSSMDGAGIGTSTPDFYSKAGFAMGAGLGWLLGWAASQPDRRFDPRSLEQLANLKTYARNANTADSSEQRRWENILHRVFQ